MGDGRKKSKICNKPPGLEGWLLKEDRDELFSFACPVLSAFSKKIVKGKEKRLVQVSLVFLVVQTNSSGGRKE